MNWRRLLFPVAVAWTAVNLVGLGFAAVAGEAAHGAVHLVLMVAFGWWAVRLRHGRPAPVTQQLDPQREVLEEEISQLQRQLDEKQAGLDFAEQLLAQRAAERQAEPLPRYAPAPERKED